MIKKKLNILLFLFKVKLIKFITYEDSKRMFNLFEKFNLQKLFFELLELYIISDK